MSSWSGSAERALILSYLPILWEDNIDSALSRIHAVVPAARCTADEQAAPPRAVDPPLSASTGRRGFRLEQLPF